jgi:nucleotide-binding universal stress UspA family protein
VTARPWPSHTSACVVSAIEYAAIPDKIWKDAEGHFEAVKSVMLRRATDETAWVASQLERVEITAESIIKIDEARSVILQQAEECSADLIFINAHTYSNISRLLLGSVAGVVLRDAPCSVVVVRTNPLAAQRAAVTGWKILIGVDNSASSLAAVRYVAARPWPTRTAIKLLRAMEPVVHFAEQLLGDKEEEEEGLKLAEEILARAGLSTTLEVVTGNPTDEICNQAGAWGCDLIVVGSHNRRGLKRWLPGDVSEAVAQRAPCSVEVIREK